MVGMMSRAKAKINALKRRCVTVARRDNRNYDDLFRQSLSEISSLHERDIGQYLMLIETALRQGVLRCSNMPAGIATGSVDEIVAWVAANVKFREMHKIMNFIGSSQQPLVSVYMVTYNTEKYIGRAIDSVLSQTYTNFELIIVDDGSTDSTASIVSSYEDQRIKYIYKEHKNFAAGMNRAIMAAGGDYMIGVDSDDFIGPLPCSSYQPSSSVHYGIANPAAP